MKRIRFCIHWKALCTTLVCASVVLSACGYLPPSRNLPAELQSEPFKAPARAGNNVATATLTPVVNATPEPTQIPNCTNDLEYLADLSIPDGTQLDPDTVFEKEWKVVNTGTCNWNNAYTLRLIAGDPLGADPSQVMVPARNGAETVLRIEFTAPTESGKYTATWQAFGPDGVAFGEWLTIEIGVTTP